MSFLYFTIVCTYYTCLVNIGRPCWTQQWWIFYGQFLLFSSCCWEGELHGASYSQTVVLSGILTSSTVKLTREHVNCITFMSTRLKSCLIWSTHLWIKLCLATYFSLRKVVDRHWLSQRKTTVQEQITFIYHYCESIKLHHVLNCFLFILHEPHIMCQW